MEKFELKNVKGSYDYGSSQQIIRDYISDTLKSVFERYGYKPLSTSQLCYFDLLALKYDEGNEILNEIYKVKDQARRNLGLRYDLTVPFAKYIALNKNISLPYKRYEIGKVFRDGPVKQGRMREFTQCDVDSVGIEGQMIEAELMLLFVEAFSKLGINIFIKYNNRKILSGMIEECGIEKEKTSEAITVIDKFEKISKEELVDEFSNLQIEKSKIEKLINYLNMDFEKLSKEFKETKNQELQEGIKEISELNKYIDALKLNSFVKFCVTLARGQDYYTGTILETYQAEGKLSVSLGGGGRYDKIIGDFIGDGKKYPAVGIGFGLDVIFEILKEKCGVKKTKTEVYIIPMNNNIEALEMAELLRKQNINVDIDMNNAKLKKSLSYASIEEIPYVIIIGEEELKENEVILKDMEKGEQRKAKIEDVIKFLIKKRGNDNEKNRWRNSF